MNRQARAHHIQLILDQLYPNPPIPLDHRDPYTLLIAVVLSAQCTDVRVNQVTPALFSRASTPERMILLSVEEIATLVRRCGLSTRKARAIWDLSYQLVHQYGGKVPNTFEALESLPGVGHKTASVVMSQAFHYPAFPVDTHIHRLAHRWGLSNGRNVRQTERDLKTLFSPEDWNKLHLQLISFGRQYCPARGHHPSRCPICHWIACLPSHPPLPSHSSHEPLNST